MIKWLKRNQNAVKTEIAPNEMPLALHDDALLVDIPDDNTSSGGLFARLKRGLSKTRNQLGDSLGRLLLGKKKLMQPS